MACRAEGPGQGMDPKLADLYRHVGELLSRYKSGKLPKAFKIIPNLRNWQQVSSLAWQRSLHGAFADCKYRAARQRVNSTGMAFMTSWGPRSDTLPMHSGDGQWAQICLTSLSHSTAVSADLRRLTGTPNIVFMPISIWRHHLLRHISSSPSTPEPHCQRHTANAACTRVQVLQLTDPAHWSPHAVYQATRLFVSNLNARMAQRFLALVLLPHIRNDIEDNKRLHHALFQAIKKATYKPDAFFKVSRPCSGSAQQLLLPPFAGKIEYSKTVHRALLQAINKATCKPEALFKVCRVLSTHGGWVHAVAALHKGTAGVQGLHQ